LFKELNMYYVNEISPAELTNKGNHKNKRCIYPLIYELFF
jgi:hypothetical protein